MSIVINKAISLEDSRHCYRPTNTIKCPICDKKIWSYYHSYDKDSIHKWIDSNIQINRMYKNEDGSYTMSCRDCEGVLQACPL